MLNYYESPSTHSGIANAPVAAPRTSLTARSAMNTLWGSLLSGSKGINSSWEEMCQGAVEAEGPRT